MDLTFGRALSWFRGLLALPGSLLRAVHSLKQAVAAAERDSARRDNERQAELRALRTELRDRMLQYSLQLGRLAALVGETGRADRVATYSVRVPAALDESPPPVTLTPVDAGEWLHLDRCPACGAPERTVVCEWNKLLLLESAPDDRSAIYDYAVCHGCGILFATERPCGARYRYLVAHFEDVLDKNAAKNPLLNPYPLTDDDRVRYRSLLAAGPFISDGIDGPRLNGVFSDRFDNAGHVDLLGSLLDLRGARVLEVRSRAGTILEGLRRLYGAEVFAMPIWESQQFVLRELYGIETSALIDFEDFRIPFEGEFDLIICNHLFNHAVRLDLMLERIRAALRPGGHVYFYNEIDDREFLDGRQSMIATLNPLHLQAADQAALVRALAAAGLETTFVRTRRQRHLCLARRADVPARRPLDAEGLRGRVDRYLRARDRAVLRAPVEVRARFAATWDATVARAVATGGAVFDASGALRVTKE